MNFELLDHPADIGFRAYATTLQGLYVSSAQALVSLILDPSHIEPKQELAIRVEGMDFESLLVKLVNWLNEVLYLIDSKRLALSVIEVLNLEKYWIKCIAGGEPRDPEKHPVRLIVKAVTYHQLKIVQTPAGWSADVYVDV